MDIRWLQPGAEPSVLAAGHLFDEPPTPEWTADYLARPGHHLAIAFVDDTAAGFVTGVEMTHPDKGPEMFLYELAVDERFRQQGIGTALVEALAARAEEHGCYGMWVATDADNEAAIRTYRRAGSSEPAEQVVLDWQFGGDEPGSPTN